MFGLVLATLLPALAFGAAASWEALRRHGQAAETRLLDTAGALAAAVDSHVASRIAALTVLAAAPDTVREDTPQAFAALARSTGAAFGAWVVLYAADGTMILNTSIPDAAPMPPRGGGMVQRVLEAGVPMVSNLTLGRVSGRQVAMVLVPVRRDGAPWRVAGMPLLPERLHALLAGQAAGGRGAIAVTDAIGVLVAHSSGPARLVGQQRPPRPDDGQLGRTGVLRGQSLADGAAIRTAYHVIPSAPGWKVWVNEPEASFLEAQRGPLLALAGGGLLALTIGLSLAAALSRRLLRPVAALVAHAEAVAGRDTWHDAPRHPVPPARIREFERLRLALAASEAALREAEAKYRRVQRIGRVGGFMIDLRSGSIDRSPEYIDLYGRAPSPSEASHEAWLQRLHPADRERADRTFREAVADGAPHTEYAQDYRIIDPDGEIRWISARAQIERDASGRALRMIGAHVDVTALKRAEAAMRDGEERLRQALEAAELGAWEIDLRQGRAMRTARTLEIFGYGSEAQFGEYPAWRDRVHPEDRAALTTAVDSVRLGRAERYRVAYRFLRPDGAWRWVESQGHAAERDPATGEAIRMIGTTQDITARREAEDRQALLSRELDHRAKNALAIVQAALRLTPREDAAAFASTVEGRVASLARAHTLLAQGRWVGADLRAVVMGEIKPFLGSPGFLGGQGPEGPHATLEGPPVPVLPAAVQALSMAFHELATNAAKYGALSATEGHLAVTWSLREIEDVWTLHLSWHETGGPGTVAPIRRGFGSTLVEATIRRQLGGRLELDWRTEGLHWQAWVPLARLAAEAAPRADP
ncbi:sensor histidine kinase [Falsiroseomonas sp. E2-1-a20]|uniref:sensor histidine kinase n=1 Tax=Falsiroseomonas sp. E2-1-a20 TaxID=3239300 RepID=UPI003F37155C